MGVSSSLVKVGMKWTSRSRTGSHSESTSARAAARSPARAAGRRLAATPCGRPT